MGKNAPKRLDETIRRMKNGKSPEPNRLRVEIKKSMGKKEQMYHLTYITKHGRKNQYLRIGNRIDTKKETI